MGLSTFCGILTLQVGVTVLAAVFLTLGAVVLVVNIFEDEEDDGGGGGGEGAHDGGNGDHKGGGKGGEDEEDDSLIGYPKLFVLLFSILMFIIGGLAFCSAYSESRGLALGALLVLILLTTFWIILSILSFMSNPSTMKTVCQTLSLRCPETFWLAILKYRKKGAGDEKKGGGEDKHGKNKREIKETLEDLIINESFFAFELQQILDELRNFNSCFNSCCKEECFIHGEKQNNSYCNFDILSKIVNSKLIIKGLMDLYTLTNEFLKIITKSAHELQNHSSVSSTDFGMRQLKLKQLPMPASLPPTTVHVTPIPTLWGINSRFLRNAEEGGKEPTPNKSVSKKEKEANKSGSKKENEASDEDGSEGENMALYSSEHEGDKPLKKRKKKKGDEKESKYIFGLPFLVAIILFVANLLFLLFSLLTFWSWYQELSNECDMVDDYVYYY